MTEPAEDGGLRHDSTRSVAPHAGAVWAVRDQDEIWALFATYEAAEEYRCRYLESETAQWADTERPGHLGTIEVEQISVFATADEVPQDFFLGWES